MVPQLGSRMRARLARFLGNVSVPLCRRARVFVMDMVYGMLASGSVLLTEIGRQLGEGISLKHTEKRLSRSLARTELAPVISEALCREAAEHVREDTLLILGTTHCQALCSEDGASCHHSGWEHPPSSEGVLVDLRGGG